VAGARPHETLGGLSLTTAELLRLAVPSAIFAVLTNAFRAVDQYWIQGVSTEAQAAIGASTFVVILFYAAFVLVAAGAGPLVARAAGADDPEGIRQSLGASIGGALLVGGVASATGVLGADGIAWMIGLEGQTAAEFSIYLRVLSWTLLPLVFTPLVDQCFISLGNARMPMVLHGVSLALNVVLTPLLIFDAGWGIAGAALASNLSRLLTTSIGLWLLARRTGLRPTDISVGPHLRRVLRIGGPAAMGIATYTLVYWAMLKTSISPLGPEVNAALGIGFNALEGFTWPAFTGLSMAVGSLVGRSLGAGRPDQAWAAVKLALPFSTGLGLLATAVFWFAGEPLTGLFTQDPVVHAHATTYTLILAWSQLFVAWEALAEGVLSGAGDTRTVFWASFPLNLTRIPLAWLLAFPLAMAAPGIWWAINTTTVAKALLKGWLVHRGRWATLEI
jgi:multidrug resistance protein, MATE family